jgi:hypothetical protein
LRRFAAIALLDTQPTTPESSIAGVACLHLNLIVKGDELFDKFNAALEVTKTECPRAARSIALSACRSPDPIAAARHYVEIYNSVLQMVSPISRLCRCRHKVHKLRNILDHLPERQRPRGRRPRGARIRPPT